jgi:hypothetical protein
MTNLSFDELPKSFKLQAGVGVAAKSGVSVDA